eukprot:3595502-Amphidinium_carterae.1
MTLCNEGLVGPRSREYATCNRHTLVFQSSACLGAASTKQMGSNMHVPSRTTLFASVTSMGFSGYASAFAH